MSKNKINLINVNYNKSKNSNIYIEQCFSVAFRLIKNKFSYKLINGPISKKKFLQKKYLGVTEYISKKFNSPKNAMLIFNKKLSVCPLTTHYRLRWYQKK